MEIGTGYLEREETADAIAEDAMERQAYEKHLDAELSASKAGIRRAAKVLEMRQRRHIALTGKRYVW